MGYNRLFIASGSGTTVDEAAQAAEEKWQEHVDSMLPAAQTESEKEGLRRVLNSSPSVAYDPNTKQWGCVIAITYDPARIDTSPRRINTSPRPMP
jgi:hypothetical protein